MSVRLRACGPHVERSPAHESGHKTALLRSGASRGMTTRQIARRPAPESIVYLAVADIREAHFKEPEGRPLAIMSRVKAG